MIVSGSRDGTAIVWDMSRFIFVRQLSDHVGIVAAVAINDLTGDIATCSATYLHVWSANGDPLATVNTCIGSADRMQQILCVTFSTAREWDPQNVVITGSTDGVVRMWSMEYVQVPKPNKEPRTMPSVEEPSVTVEQSKVDLVKQISITHDDNVLAKSGSESSISEACDGVKETTKQFESEHDECSDKDDKNAVNALKGALEVPMSMSKRGSLTSAKSLHELKHESTIEGDNGKPSTSSSNAGGNNTDEGINSKGIRPSKSETSIIDSFVVIDNEYSKRKHCPNVLREGFEWQRQLVFRSKLTMHTAYDRKDNAEPASITALAVSKDHKTLYVGDARGRVFSWNVTEQPGRGMADHWLKDEGADQCVGCHVKFTLYERKHHCRNCGQVFCNKCSRFESEISRLRILRPVRVCQACYATLRHHSTDS